MQPFLGMPHAAFSQGSFMRRVMPSCLLIAVGVRAAAAATYTYTGPGGTSASPVTGTWNAAANWAENAVPASSTGTVLVFGGAAGAAAYTANDDISGTFSLNALTLSSANTSAAGTISGNALNFGGPAPTLTQNGAGAFVVANNLALTATTAFGGSGVGNVTLSGTLSGAGIGLTVANAGGASLIISGTASALTGAITINNGARLQVGDGANNSGTLYTGVSGQITDNGTLTFGRPSQGSNLTQGGSFSSAPIVGSGAVVMASAGSTLVLTAANTYTGTTTIAAGVLQLGSASFPTAGALSGTGAILDNGILSINRTDTVTQGTQFGTIGGTGLVRESAAGTTVLNAANTFSGGVDFNAGVIQVAGTETAGTSGPLGRTGTLRFAGGTLQFSAADTFDYSSRFGTGTTQAYSVDTNGQSVTFASAIGTSSTNTSTFTKLGAGTLVLTGTNLYSGSTTVSAGTLQIGNGPTGQLSAAGPIVDNAAVVFARTNTLTQNQSFGLISGSGTVAQAGSGGLLRLNQNNTYSGGTTVSAGTLQANTTGTGNSATGTGNVTVTSGGTLAGGSAGTSGQVGGAVAVNAGGKITAGSGATVSDSVGTLTTGNQTWTGSGTAAGTGATYVWKVAGGGTVPGTNWDLLNMATLNLTATGGNKVTLSGIKSTGSTYVATAGSYVIAHAASVQVNGATPAAADLTGLFALDLSGIGITDTSGVTVTYASPTSGGSGFDVSLNYAPAPEPTTAALFGASAASLLGVRPRRRR